MSENAKETVIAEGTELDGTIKSDCGITLNGRLKGSVTAPSLVVRSSGSVDGRVDVSELRSKGSISGQVKAKNVQLAGKVSDNTVIHASTLDVQLVEPSAGLHVTFGNCELHIGKQVATTSETKGQSDQKPELVGQGKSKRS